MDSDKYEKRMNRAINNPYPVEVAKAFTASFPDKFLYNGNGWHINTENESYRHIDDGELRMFIDQEFAPLIMKRSVNDKRLLNKLRTNSFKHGMCCELQGRYRK